MKRLALLLLALLGPAVGAEATYTVTIQQVGTDVVAIGFGALNITGLNAEGPLSGLLSVNASDPSIVLGANAGQNYGYDAFISPATGYGAGGLKQTFSGTGDTVGFDSRVSLLGVPSSSYNNGVLSSSITFANASFASLGLTPGSYTYGYSATRGGAIIDSFVINIVPFAPIPEPASLSLCGVAGLVLAGVRLGRRRLA